MIVDQNKIPRKKPVKIKNDRDQTGAPEILLKKTTPTGVVYISECVPDSANKIIWITSAYANYNKKGSKGQLLNIEDTSSPQLTPEASFDGNATTIIIPQNPDLSTPDAKIPKKSDDGQMQHRRVGEEDRQVLARAAKSLARSDADNEIVKAYFARLEEYRAKQKELDGISGKLEADNWGEAKLEGSERYGLLQRQVI